MNFCYGKKPPEPHKDTLLLDKYILPSALPPPESKRAWEYSVNDNGWGMLGNDQVGDCVIAAILHWIMAAEASAGRPVPGFITQDALDLYSAITGYVQGYPSTDQGTAWTDALAYMVSTGFKGYKFRGWASIDYRNPMKMNQAIDIFGAALIGTRVTASMEQQFSNGEAWNAPFGGDVQGLHGIPFLGYGREGRTFITWGKRTQSDLNFPSQFDEAYVAITDSFLDAAGKTPGLALDLDALVADLPIIGDGVAG